MCLRTYQIHLTVHDKIKKLFEKGMEEMKNLYFQYDSKACTEINADPKYRPQGSRPLLRTSAGNVGGGGGEGRTLWLSNSDEDKGKVLN